LIRVDPRALTGAGLVVALVAGLAGLAARGTLLAGVWSDRSVPGVGKLGTPLLFDLGVFLVVVGAVLTILFTLDEESG
jgi:multicomponent Na+:H+ antiporter subunit B